MLYSRIQTQSNKSPFGPNFLNLSMQALHIEILDPEALKLIKEMEARNLISIKRAKPDEFLEFVNKMRAKAAAVGDIPTLEEITKEVEIVRAERYAKK